MRIHVRNQILELITTLIEAGQYIRKSAIKNAEIVAKDCKQALNSINQSLKEGLTEESYLHYEVDITDAKKSLELTMDNIRRGGKSLEDILVFNNALENLMRKMEKESEVKLEVLFLPYKYSMWDSLESIWLSAKDDSNCNSYVMPIPYYDRDPDGLLKQFNYEGMHFLENDIPIVSYKDYDIAKQRPDIIYFHNPYDGNNLITSVSPEFYTDRLKHYTDMLVYVPYFIAGAYRNAKDAESKCITNGVLNASKVIVQSEVLREVYIENGISPDKMVALGSPKIDSILNLKHKNKLPSAWKQKTNGKKVILLNSSLRRLLNNPNYMHDLKDIMETILNDKNNVLIWRPHPLMQSAISSMRPEYNHMFNELKGFIKENENSILDENSDVTSAIVTSDAMISDGSSIIRTYIMTGKPILVLESSEKMRESAFLSCDVYSCYFYNDGITIKDFVEMVSLGFDPQKAQRVSNFRNSILNNDGSCGKKIHQFVFNAIKSNLK